MKFLRSSFLLLALLLIALPAMSQTTVVNPCENLAETTRGKSADEAQSILRLCRDSKPALSISTEAVPDAEEVNEWTSVAKGFAEAVGILAQKLGVAVNDFLRSPAGILLALVLIVKHAGGVLIGIPFVIFSVLVFAYVVRRVTTGKVTYENVPLFWGMLTMRRKASVERLELNGDATGTLAMTAIGLLFLDLIVCLNV